MVDGTGLENQRAGNGTEGSNPSLSAKKIFLTSEKKWGLFFEESEETTACLFGDSNRRKPCSSLLDERCAALDCKIESILTGESKIPLSPPSYDPPSGGF